MAILCFGSVASAGGQSPGRALETALESLTGGPGGCFSEAELKDTTFDFFPGVRFIRRYCTLEHGDPTSAIVAIDSDSVLYLLGSTDALNFLLARHPIKQLDSATVMLYAPVALELAGAASGYSRIVDDPKAGGPELFRALERLRGRVWKIYPQGIGRTIEWNVVFGRVEPAYEGQRAFLTDFYVRRDGVASLIRDSIVTPLPIH